MAILPTLLVAAAIGTSPSLYSLGAVDRSPAIVGMAGYVEGEPEANRRVLDEANEAGLIALDAAGVPRDYLEKEQQKTPPPRTDATPAVPVTDASSQDAVSADGSDASPDSSANEVPAEPVATAPTQVAFGPPAETKLAANSAARIPIVGLEGPGADACAGIGRVSNLGRESLIELSVHAAPSSAATKADALGAGDLVWLCEAADKWQGIVYAAGDFQELSDCRVSSPVAKPEDYAGPCAHGWVEARFLTVVAG